MLLSRRGSVTYRARVRTSWVRRTPLVVRYNLDGVHRLQLNYVSRPFLRLLDIRPEDLLTSLKRTITNTSLLPLWPVDVVTFGGFGGIVPTKGVKSPKRSQKRSVNGHFPQTDSVSNLYTVILFGIHRPFQTQTLHYRLYFYVMPP